MSNTKHRRGPNSLGQGLVEFALVLPVLMLILLGAVDLGRVFHDYVTMTNASREGARYGIAHPKDTSGIQSRAIEEAAASGIALASDNVSVSCLTYDGTTTVSCDQAYNGDRLQVTITHDFEFVTLYLFRVQHISLSSFTVMAITHGLTHS